MELPFDLVEEILLRVPTKSLVRLRYTCKQWETLVSNPKFFYKHLPREQRFTVFNEISHDENNSPSSKISCVGIVSKEPCLQVEFVKTLDSEVLYMYHCDGLLLLVMETKLLVLNPLLKERRWIQRGGFDIGHNTEITTYGLGYISNQSNCNDCKIVRFQGPDIYEKFRGVNVQVYVDVYDFKCDRWKRVVDETFDGFDEQILSSVCLRGTPYWLGYNNMGDEYGIRTISMASFDFSNERFEYVFQVLDESFGSIHSWKDSLSLGIFKGDHLALLHGDYKKGNINIWVMKVDKDWSKLMTIVLPDVGIRMYPTLSSYFIENNGRLILTVCYYKYTSFIYVVGENQRLHLLTDSPINVESVMGACYYVPSLLQVPAFQGEKKKNNKKKRKTKTKNKDKKH